MKRLIKRYVLKAQVDRESDEVNEGKNKTLIEVIFHHQFPFISEHVRILL